MAQQKKAPSKRTRNARRQLTPPLVIHAEPKGEEQSGVSRVNKEIATLIARKDPLLNQVSKKSKSHISRQKKQRMEAKMVKAAAKADQLVEKTSKSQQRGKEIKKRRSDWEVINEKEAGNAREKESAEDMVIE